MLTQITHLNKNLDIHTHGNDDDVSLYIKNTRSFYELGFLEYIRLNYNKHNIILDIGANIGNHSLFFSEYLDHTEIICFEPYSANVDLLYKNVTDKTVKIYNCALSDSNSLKPLYNSSKNNNGGYSLHFYDGSKGENQSFVVEEGLSTKTLDSFNLKNITMIKIDVEGHEDSVLRGAIDTIINNKPIIFLENLAHGYPHLFKVDQFDKFFTDINYIKKETNICNGFMDLWIPDPNQIIT